MPNAHNIFFAIHHRLAGWMGTISIVVCCCNTHRTQRVHDAQNTVNRQHGMRDGGMRANENRVYLFLAHTLCRTKGTASLNSALRKRSKHFTVDSFFSSILISHPASICSPVATHAHTQQIGRSERTRAMNREVVARRCEKESSEEVRKIHNGSYMCSSACRAKQMYSFYM